MLKKIVLYSVALSVMFAFYTVQSVSSNTNTLNELVEIMEVVETKDMVMRSWDVYAKEENVIVLNEDEVEHVIKNKKETFNGFQWTEEQAKDHQKTVGVKSSNHGLNERVVITSYESAGQHLVSLTHQISGVDWKADTLEFITDQLNGDDVYVTVRATMAKVEGQTLDQLAEGLIDQFAGEVKEGMTESEFVSISAYTKSWDNGVAINETDQINVQVGLRDLGQPGTVDVTIGTPIITAEY
ncbi:YwmB family TATA-box binding protein [Halalkalibacter okhensis]|uniref:YwmB family TATA-box binding protein n=1 Tax=Halalkalibacter okhensis TaxID=333138 RepID=UPI00068C6C1F|nr:YwmB family TATA-box binding protein [Halalkalibacter okhensis]